MADIENASAHQHHGIWWLTMVCAIWPWLLTVVKIILTLVNIIIHGIWWLTNWSAQYDNSHIVQPWLTMVKFHWPWSTSWYFMSDHISLWLTVKYYQIPWWPWSHFAWKTLSNINVLSATFTYGFIHLSVSLLYKTLFELFQDYFVKNDLCYD